MDDPLGRQLLLQLLLILINAFFAAAEIAVISLNPAKLQKMMEDGEKGIKVIYKMAVEPSGFLSTIQIGITLAGFLGSAFAAQSFSDRLANWAVNGLGITSLSVKTLDAIAVIVVTIILSYFTLVFGELVPKRVAMQKPLAIAKFACKVIKVFAVIFKPAVWFLSVSTNIVLKLFGSKGKSEDKGVTEEEILMMVDIGEENGAIESSEKEMIENIFEFNNTTAGDVMTPSVDIVGIYLEDTAEEILDIIRDSGRSRFPVFNEDEDDVVGILNTKDFLLNYHEQTPKALRELLRPAHFVPETVHTDVLLREMQKNQSHIAIVVDEYGSTSGIVTMEDLLEEIVGNIYDEFDSLADADITKLGDNLWRISGSADIRDIEDELDIELPEDLEFSTLGGLVFSNLNSIPDDGSKLDIVTNGLHIMVDDISDHRVRWANVEVIEKPEESGENGDEE